VKEAVEEQIQRYMVLRWLRKNYFSGLLVCLIAFSLGGLSYFFAFSGFELGTFIIQPLAEISVIVQLTYIVVFFLLISIPIALGSTTFFLFGLQGKNWRIHDLLFAFKSSNYWRGMLIQSVRYLIVFSIVLIPVVGFIFVGVPQSNWFILFMIACVAPIYYKYRFTAYVFIETPQLDLKKNFKRSAYLTDGVKWRLFVIDLSFMALFFVGSRFFGIGGLLVTPYYEAFVANYYLNLCERKNIGGSVEVTADE